jgi:hypothetical protein
LPRATHPEFALAYSNLQLLCATCNQGKGNRDTTDWRFRGATSPKRKVPSARSRRRLPRPRKRSAGQWAHQPPTGPTTPRRRRTPAWPQRRHCRRWGRW